MMSKELVPSFSSPRHHLFGIRIDAVTRRQAVEILERRIAAGGKEFVVTPNVDHIVQLERNSAFRAAYARATLILADGMPLVWAARLLGRSLPERVTGKYLLPDMMESAAKHGWRVFLLGAAPGIGERAAGELRRRFPALIVAGLYSPPFGFEHDPAQSEHIVRLVNEARTDILVLALGTPKQELWLAQHFNRLHFRCALGVGAAVDFVAGTVPQVPRWMEKVGLEWFWRLLHEPRRLWRRYLVNDWPFLAIVLREFRTRSQSTGRRC